MRPKYWKEATAHLGSACPALAGMIAAYDGEMLSTRGDAFYTLARSIAGQQISVKAADSVWGKVANALKNKVTPRNMLELSDEEMRASGLSGQKVKYMRSLAEHFIQHKITENYWDKMTDEEVIANLTEIKGIGVWTAEMFLIFHLMRPDVYPLADIGLQKAILKHYPKMKGKEKDKVKMLKHAKQWQPYRSVATWYLWRSLDPIPVEY